MLNRLRVLWFALFSTTVVYALIDWFLLRDRTISQALERSLRSPLTIGLYTAAVLAYFGAFLLGGSIARKGQEQPAFVAKLALLESVCILGLVAAFLAQDWRLYLPPWMLSVVGFARAWPSATSEAA